MLIGGLLVAVILLQKTNVDGIANLASNSQGIVSSKASANFLTRATTILAIIFMLNSLVLANLSSRKTKSLNDTITTQEHKIPIR